MPQLSPLNWIILSGLFWMCFIYVSILIWWSSKISFMVGEMKNISMTENKWIWY